MLPSSPVPQTPTPVHRPTPAAAAGMGASCAWPVVALLLIATPACAEAPPPPPVPMAAPGQGSASTTDLDTRLLSPWVADLQALRQEQAAMRARTADLELSLRHSEQRIVAYGLLAALVVTARVFIRWAIRRWRRWFGFNPHIKTMDLFRAPPAAPSESDEAREAQPPLKTPPFGTEASWTSSALDGPPRRHIPPPMVHPTGFTEASRVASASVEPDLRLAPHLALLNRVDEWTAQGRWGEAILQLESALHEGPAKSAWLLLKLLDLYQQLQELHPHERVAHELMTLYRVRVPTAALPSMPVSGPVAPQNQGPGVLSAALSDLQRHWGDADIAERFRSWLVHPHPNAAQALLDRHGFERVLTLCALALEPTEPPPTDDLTLDDAPPLTLGWPLAA